MRSQIAVALTVVVVGTGISLAQNRQASAPARAAQATSMQPIASVKELMLAMTVPTSETVFKAASEPPTDDGGWMAVRRQALALAESANLLLLPGRALDQQGWVTFAVAQRDAAVVALKAAEGKNGEALATASDTLYETCDGCHKRYMPGK